MSQALNKPSKDLLVDLINKTNGKNFAVADLVFGTPEPHGDHPSFNSTVKVNLASKPEPENSLSLFYNRIDFGKMFEGKLVAIVDTGSFNSTDDFIPYLNTTYGLGLVAGDLAVSAFTVGAKPYPVIIRANPSCLAYFGQFEVQVVTTVVDPTPDTASFNQTLGDAFQQVNDMLFIDGMLEDGHFAKTVDTGNGTILASRARSEEDGPAAPFTPESPAYALGQIVAAGGGWSFDFAAQFDMAAREGYVTDYYDIKAEIIREGDNAKMTFTLTQTNGVFAFVSGALSIPVDYVYNRGQQLQGNFDMTVVGAHAAFAAAFVGTLTNADSAPYDVILYLDLIANRKGDADDRHYLSIAAMLGNQAP